MSKPLYEELVVTPEERLESARHGPEPARALRAAVLELSQQGQTPAAIYDLLEQFLLRLRTRNDYRESEEEAVLDLMDAVTGWCHPQARLFTDDPASGL